MKPWDEVEDAYACVLAGDVEGAKYHLEKVLTRDRQVQALNHSKHVKSMLDLRAKQAAAPANAEAA